MRETSRFGRELFFLAAISKRSQQPNHPKKSTTMEGLGIYIYKNIYK